MKRAPIPVAVLIAVLAIGGSAAADPEVTPDPARPGLILSDEVIVRPGTPHSPAPSNDDTAPVNHRDAVLTVCEVDVRDAIQCYLPVDDEPADPDDPELTQGDVLRAVREIGLPSLKVRIQPGEETLVNIETIFYTQPQPFERSIMLLGFDIDLVAEPVRYTWVHDDGTVSTTSRPGKPYPAMDVTHRYREPDDDVHPRVDVTYRVRYRVDGGAWQTIGQTLEASGPAAELDVREAAPVLTHP